MSHLAISLYPEKSSLPQMEEYMKLASDAGAKRVFSCLLSAKKDRQTVLEEYRALCDLAHQYGMEVILDTSKSVFEHLSIPLDDLSFFTQMHADGIRLDGGFTPREIAYLTLNPAELKIELNATLPEVLREIMIYPNNPAVLQLSHNFYPQKYTGLSMDYFEACNAFIEDFGLPVGAFVSSQNPEAIGPWPIQEGLCTLEYCRDLPIEEQARVLMDAGMEEIMVANQPATARELKALSRLFRNEIYYYADRKTPKEILEALEEENFLRGDRSSYVIRFARRSPLNIEPMNTKDIEAGDIVILNNLYPHYAGEIQIALVPMENDGRKNVIGTLDPERIQDIDFTLPTRMIRSN